MTYRLCDVGLNLLLGYFSECGTCILGLNSFILFIHIFLAFCNFMGISSLHRFFFWGGGSGVGANNEITENAI